MQSSKVAPDRRALGRAPLERLQLVRVQLFQIATSQTRRGGYFGFTTTICKEEARACTYISV